MMAGLVTISAYYNDVQLTGVRCVGRWRNGNIDLVSCGASQVMNGAEKNWFPLLFPRRPLANCLSCIAGQLRASCLVSRLEALWLGLKTQGFVG